MNRLQVGQSSWQGLSCCCGSAHLPSGTMLVLVMPLCDVYDND